jgi:hypothetical protein
MKVKIPTKVGKDQMVINLNSPSMVVILTKGLEVVDQEETTEVVLVPWVVLILIIKTKVVFLTIIKIMKRKKEWEKAKTVEQILNQVT